MLECFARILPAIMMLAASSGFAATWYVSPTGSDANPGTQASPLATIMGAQSKASSGDIVYIMAGTYNLATNVYDSVEDGVYASVNVINKDGITYEAVPGTRPVFDFSAVNPSGKRVAAFWVTATGVTFQGFDVVGIRENITNSNNQSLGFGIWGCKSCTWNMVNVHDADCVGFYIEKVSANNLIYRCDSYNNTGIDSFSYGNADGFGGHPAAGGTNNIFRECRSWNNSDDGYDCINAHESVTFDHCWSYKNGNNGGNGNGFKVGGFGSTGQNQIADPIPSHTVRFCLSAQNNGNAGYYANHQPAGPGAPTGWTNNTSYNNSGPDFDMLQRTPPDYATNAPETDANDISGTNEEMHFNLAYKGTITGDYGLTGSPMVASNSWNESVTVSAADFLSTDATQMTNARAADGSLPVITFMHLAAGSDLAGLGCFIVPPAPTNLTATVSNTQVVLSWTPSTGATGYNVKRSTTSGSGFTNIAANVTLTNFTDSGLASGTKYYYVVTALNPGDESTNSVQAGVTTAMPAPPQFGSITTTGVNLIFSGTGGVTNGSYYLLASTNITTPVSNWTRLLTNQFDNSGNFNFTNPMNPDSPQNFYRLQLP